MARRIQAVSGVDMGSKTVAWVLIIGTAAVVFWATLRKK